MHTIESHSIADLLAGEPIRREVVADPEPAPSVASGRRSRRATVTPIVEDAGEELAATEPEDSVDAD